MSKFHYFAKGKFGIADLGAMAIIVYPDAWEHEEFLEFVEGVRGMMRSDIFSLLVWANGQALSAKERAVLSERLPAPKNAPPMRQALLTDSTLMRGVLTAVGWIVNKADYRMPAFSTSEARAAIREDGLCLEYWSRTCRLDPDSFPAPEAERPGERRSRAEPPASPP